ncbi:MAG: hypothetical protein E7627_08080 [Ruminococcaceae bacterium]|nr:hypothetical protein [Oscillospiraceae bacterium]
MKIDLISNASETRQKFTRKFCLTFDEYIKAYPDIIETYAKMGKVFGEEIFRKKFMWDKMSTYFSAISQTSAIEFLKGIDRDVLFMSEGEDFNGSCHLKLGGQLHKGFLARGNAKELAELIEYEWRESWKQAIQDQYFDCSLPEDLYVFDESMKCVLVFTHEGDGATMEEQMNHRYCKAYGVYHKENVQ